MTIQVCEHKGILVSCRFSRASAIVESDIYHYTFLKSTVGDRPRAPVLAYVQKSNGHAVQFISLDKEDILGPVTVS